MPPKKSNKSIKTKKESKSENNSDNENDSDKSEKSDTEENESKQKKEETKVAKKEEDIDDEEIDDDNIDEDNEMNGDTDLTPTNFTFKEPIRGEKEIIIIKPENRITSDLMTKQELTEAISIRIKLLEQEQIAFVDTSDLSDPASIAKRELDMKRCPLTLRRCIGSYIDQATGKTTDYYEYWDVNEMMKPLNFNI